MRARVAIVADDLTGAADTGAGFLRMGHDTVVTWGDVTVDLVAEVGADVLAIDLRSRVMDASSAAAATAAAVTTLRAAGIGTLYKKIDSLLRGHVGEEVRAALTSWHTEAVAIVAPAFPAMGRTTVGGVQHVGGVPLPGGAIADLLNAAGIPTNCLGTERFQNESSISRAIDDLNRNGARAIVCDAATDDDLLWIARAGQQLVRPVLWVGTGGLAASLASSLSRQQSRISAFGRSVTRSKGILFLVGSGHEISQRQAERLHAAGAAHVQIPLAVLSEGSDEDGAAVATNVDRHLANGEEVVVTINPPAPGDNPRIANRLGDMLRRSASVTGAAVFTGGDTATGALGAWDVRGLRLVEEIERGVPLSLSVGKTSMPIVTKAGAFGHAETLVLVRDRLRRIVGAAEGV